LAFLQLSENILERLSAFPPPQICSVSARPFFLRTQANKNTAGFLLESSFLETFCGFDPLEKIVIQDTVL